MSRVFVSGSSTGLGLMAARLLVEQGHQVVLHARNQTRTDEAREALPEAQSVVVGDVCSLAGARSVADQVNTIGGFDAVIHNVGVGPQASRPIETEDGLPHIFAVNTLAPYVLTALIDKPKRLVYLSSGMHRSAEANFADLIWQKRPWSGTEAYAESKLHDVLLAFATARRWPGVFSNAVEPGWVPTRMGGPDAPDDLEQGYRTQAWLAVSNEVGACVTGKYFFHMHHRAPHPKAYNVELQEQLIEACQRLSGVALLP